MELFRLFDKRSPLSRFPAILDQLFNILSAHCTAEGAPVERVVGRTKAKIVLMLSVVRVVNRFFFGMCIIAHFILNLSLTAHCLPLNIQMICLLYIFRGFESADEYQFSHSCPWFHS